MNLDDFIKIKINKNMRLYLTSIISVYKSSRSRKSVGYYDRNLTISLVKTLLHFKSVSPRGIRDY